MSMGPWLIDCPELRKSDQEQLAKRLLYLLKLLSGRSAAAAAASSVWNSHTMPGRCFSWTKSLSFKALSSNSKSSDSANICRDDSQSGSFSSIALKGGDSSSSTKRSRTSSCGCTASMVSRCSPPMIPNLRDVIIHGSSKLLLLQSSKAQSAVSTASSSSSPRKSDSYIHQSQTGEYYYRAPLKSKHAAGNNNNHKLQLRQLVEGAGSSKGFGSGNNMCLVRGCCECSMQASCSQISPELVADQSFPTIRGSATSLIHSVGALHGSTSPKCVCTKCGEAFYKPEALELHQISRHAGESQISATCPWASWPTRDHRGSRLLQLAS